MQKSEIPCKFYQKGRCLKGASCPYKHGDSSNSDKPKYEKLGDSIRTDFIANQVDWPFTSYGIEPYDNLISGKDISFEELHFQTLKAKENGILPQFEQEVKKKVEEASLLHEFIAEDPMKAGRYIELAAKASAKPKPYEPPENYVPRNKRFGLQANQSGQGGVFGTSNSFRLSSPFGNISAFGSGNAFSSSSFESGSFGNINATSGLGNNTSTQPSGFGQHGFGQSAFSKLGQAGQSAFGSGQSTFGSFSSSSNVQSSPFGKLSGPDSTSPFGKLASTDSSKPSGLSPFAAGASTSPFAKLSGSNSNPFAVLAENSTGSKEQTGQQGSLFGSQTTSASSSPFGATTDASNQSPFDKLSGSTPFNQLPAATSTSSPFATSTAFGQQASSPFGKLLSSSPGFGQAAQSNTGQPISSPFGRQASSSPFGKQTALSPFNQPDNTTVGTSLSEQSSPFGESRPAFGHCSFGQTSQIANAFVPASPLGSAAGSAAAKSEFVQGRNTIQPKKPEELLDYIRAEFEAPIFTLGRIPEIVPPLEYRSM